MALLIDASILIEHERGRIDLDGKLESRGAEEFFLSVVTASELLHGVYRAADPGVRTRRSAFVEAILERFPILPIEVASARAHARLWAELAAAGALIGPHDLWLAPRVSRTGFHRDGGNARVRAGARPPGQDWARSI